MIFSEKVCVFASSVATEMCCLQNSHTWWATSLTHGVQMPNLWFRGQTVETDSNSLSLYPWRVCLITKPDFGWAEMCCLILIFSLSGTTLGCKSTQKPRSVMRKFLSLSFLFSRCVGRRGGDTTRRTANRKTKPKDKTREEEKCNRENS